MPSIKPPSSNMPPVKPQPPAGTQTSDKYGHVISTRPVPAPEVPEHTNNAPTSDQWGHVISNPAPVQLNPAPVSHGSNMPPVHPQPPPGTQTSDKYGHVISTRPVPSPEIPPSTNHAPTSDRYGNVIADADGNKVDWK